MIEIPELSSIGERIKRQRSKKSLTQQQLADMIGVSQGTVAGWERGSSRPNVKIIGRLAEVLEVSWEYFTQTWDDVIRSSENVSSYKELDCWLDSFDDDGLDGEGPALLHLYNELNGEGKRRVFEFMFDLRQLKRYQSATVVAKQEAKAGE